MSFPKSGFKNENIKDKEILDRLEPHIKEFFDHYLLVGFKADSKEVGCIGHVGPRGSMARKKLDGVYKEMNKVMLEVEDEKD